jgi:hypothetical protein
MRTHEGRAERRPFDRMTEYYAFGRRLSHEEFIAGGSLRYFGKVRRRPARRISTSPITASPAPV